MTDGHPDRTGMVEPLHIRKKADGYRDPMAETLCGAKATTMDQPVNARATNHMTADGSQHRTARTAAP